MRFLGKGNILNHLPESYDCSLYGTEFCLPNLLDGAGLRMELYICVYMQEKKSEIISIKISLVMIKVEGFGVF